MSTNAELFERAQRVIPGGVNSPVRAFRRTFLVLLAGRQRPEEAIGHDAAHAGAEAGVQALVEELQRLADGRLELRGGAEEGGHGGRERVARADEGGLEHLELLAREGALRRGEDVVDELPRALGRQHHARDQHVARAVLRRRDGELARRGRAVGVPVGEQEIGERLVVPDQHFRGRQDQLAEGVEVRGLVVLVDPREGRQVRDHGHLGVVGKHLGDGRDVLVAAQEPHFEARNRDIFQDAARLFDDGVRIDGMLVENLGGIAHQHCSDDRQRVCAHRGDRGNVARDAAGAARVARIEREDAGGRTRFTAVVGRIRAGRDISGHGTVPDNL